MDVGTRTVIMHRWRPWYWYLLHPWRYSPIRVWLLEHSKLYRRFQAWKLKWAVARMEKVMDERLLPAVERATAAVREWMDTLEATR